MRRFVVLCVAAVLAAAATSAGTATASTLHHGDFAAGTGYLTSEPNTPVVLPASGHWTLTTNSFGTHLKGFLWTFKQPCGANEPCPFGVDLRFFDWQPGTWTDGAYATTGALDVGLGLDGVKPVHFDATFVMDAAGEATLTLAIINCPYHWGSWVITG